MNKIINIFVTLVFLISFIGITVNKHFSRGKLYSVAVFQEADDCCADGIVCDINSHSNLVSYNQHNDCTCENETEMIRISDVFIGEKYITPKTSTSFIFNFILFDKVEALLFYISDNTVHNSFIWMFPIEKPLQSKLGVFLC